MISLVSQINHNNNNNIINLIRKTPTFLEILLKDRTTNENIIWATDSYSKFGTEYRTKDQIKVNLLTNGVGALLKPRVEKDTEEQKERTADKGEVYTPIWVVKRQNDLIEKEFKNLPLEKYVNKKWLEVTCGEAPYMCTRYDTITGEFIKVNERVGFVDRKIQRISHEVNDRNKWVNLVYKAYQSSYGYEFQGDSLFLARENLLYTFIDFYIDNFKEVPSFEYIKEIALIISYNVFQMDGLKNIIPYSEEIRVSEPSIQMSLFEEFENEDNEVQLEMNFSEGIKTEIKDWDKNMMIEFNSLINY